ncbi:tryptophan 2,3-dioxygenase family protein [Streptomyces desertarenae]|uniref:Tryptophan 2,3-dioxygenase family protein n=1 Tax=Streptomyces desertarenae TaxID=2666184 RepID=A0ABW4PPJ7_9ACTN
MPVNQYEQYLHLPELLRLQHPRAGELGEAVGASETFFIVVHQSAELLLRQLLVDLGAAVRACERGAREWSDTETGLRRAAAVMRMLREHVETLDHLPRAHFLAFREFLGTASAGESVQFAKVFALFGAGGPLGAPAREPGRGSAGGRAVPESVTAGFEEVRRELRRWQEAHITLVERLIGDAKGTGGTDGVSWLRSRLLPVAEADAGDGSSAHPEEGPA